jgi:Transposase DDE domain
VPGRGEAGRTGAFDRLLAACFARARDLGLLDDAGTDAEPDAAVDSTGLETRHASAHFRRCCGRGRGREQGSWPKLTVALHTRTHLIAAAHACRGPCQDAPQFAPVVRQAAANLRPYRVLADRGYDAEHCHVLCRRELSVRTTAIPLNPRNHGRRWPKTRYRRLMKRRFPCRMYRRRAQAESGFSRLKRRLGSALTAKREDRQFDEIRMRVLTHNLMLLAGYT